LGGARITWVVGLQACALGAWAQTAAPASPAEIYVCTDEQGRRITADRSIRECIDRPQRVLNPDGSLRGVKPPSPTAEERAAREARDRKEAAEEAHREARESALDPVRLTMDLTESRLTQLKRERRALEEEARAPRNREQAAALKLQLDANDASTAAQRENTLSQKVELDRINRIYDIELERLKRLWAGQPPGSMGPIDTITPDASSRAGLDRPTTPRK
jgi:chromosome segregation ATPase